MSHQSIHPAAQELVAGFAAGAANVTSGYPFDTVKVRLQSAAPGQYRNALHCLREVVRTEGIRRGLFRGLSSPLVGGTAETGVNYLVYSRLLEALQSASQPRREPHDLKGGVADGHQADEPAGLSPLHHVALAGAVAGACLSVILGPTELVKVRMQQAGAASRYPGGPLQCLRQIVADEGGVLRGLSRGLGATLAREVPGNALFFAAYEGLRRGLFGVTAIAAHSTTSPVSVSAPGTPLPSAPGVLPDVAVRAEAGNVLHGVAASAAGISLADAEDTAAGRHWLMEAALAIFCGGAAGTIMWATVLPIDVAKTRLQTAIPGSAWDVGLRRHLAMLWQEGGVASLYAGITPTLVRAFPANACQWLAWEVAMRGMQGTSRGGREG